MKQEPELYFLDLKATTLLELYFETSMKKIEEHFIGAAAVKYTKEEYLEFEDELKIFFVKPEQEKIQFIRDTAIKCNCLKEFEDKCQ